MWVFYAISASVIWGLTYSLGEHIYRRISPLTMLGVQMLVGAIIFLAISAGTRMRDDIATLSRDRAALTWVVVAVIASNVAHIFIALSIRAKNATLAGLIEQSYPIFTVLFSWLLFRQVHVTPTTIAGAALIFAGIFVMTYF